MLTSKIYVVFNLPPHHWGCTGTLPLRGWPFVVHHDRHIDLCPGYYLLSILEPHLFLELHAVTWRTCRLCFIHIYDLCIFRSDIWSYNDIYIYIYTYYTYYTCIYIYIHIYICLLHVLPLNKIHSNISASFSPSFFETGAFFFVPSRSKVCRPRDVIYGWQIHRLLQASFVSWRRRCRWKVVISKWGWTCGWRLLVVDGIHM